MKKVKRFHWLEKMIKTHKFTIGAEIGTATGNTTEHLLIHCPGLKKYFVVDDWRPIPSSKQWNRTDLEQIFRQRINADNRIDIQKVKILKGLSWEMADSVQDGSLDWVFVDASHDKVSVKKDLEAWTPKVRKGGMMSGHDIQGEEVREALVEKFGGYEEVGVDHCWVVWIR